MPLPGPNALLGHAPVMRRWTMSCIALAVLFSALAIAAVVVRRRLGIPNQGWARYLPLALSLTPILVIAPMWWWRTRWIRRALRESGWRLCTHCGYDVSTLERVGICPECGHAYDVDKDAPRWQDIGVEPPPPDPPDRAATAAVPGADGGAGGPGD